MEVEGEARESGTPGDEDTVKCIKAGPCRRPHGVQLGSPTTWEAHCKDRRTHGSRFPLEAIVCIYVKPDTAGGPVMKKLQDTWKPVFAGDRIVHIWEAHETGYPVTH